MTNSLSIIRNGEKVTEIIATFKNGKRVKYSVASLDLLETDPEIFNIINADTGEIIFKA